MPIDDLDEDSSLEEVLLLPFGEAMRRCRGLRQHILAQNEEDNAVEEEFREHWGPSAPEELRVVLSDVAGFRSNRQSTSLQEILSTAHAVRDMQAPAPPIGNHADHSEVVRLFNEFGGLPRAPNDEPRALQLKRLLGAPEFNTIEWGGWLPGEQLVSTDTVDDLLRLPFGEALQTCAPLRRYLDNQEDPDAVEEEFYKSWGEDAPSELRETLSQLLSIAPLELAEPEDVDAQEIPQISIFDGWVRTVSTSSSDNKRSRL